MAMYIVGTMKIKKQDVYMKYICRDHRISTPVYTSVYHLCIGILEVPLSALGNILNPTLSTCL